MLLQLTFQWHGCHCAVQNRKSWDAQGTIHGGWLGDPYYLLVVHTGVWFDQWDALGCPITGLHFPTTHSYQMLTNYWEMDYSSYSYGSPILFMGRIWQPGNQQWCMGIWNYWQLNGFNGFLRLKTRRHQNFALLHLCEHKSPMMDWFPSQRASNTRTIPMSWHLHAGMLLQ